jgi:molecular chaperone GrpE
MSSKKVQQPVPKKEQTHDEEIEKNLERPEDASTKITSEAVDDITDLEKQLAEAQSQAAEYKDGWQRAVADFQNYRRRMEAEKIETYKVAVGSIIKQYLPVLDDMERAMESKPADLAWAGGIELIYRKLQSILDAEGVKRIDAIGKIFDPNYHEAIAQEPAEDVESGTVIEVVRNGYMLGERVIRPAMVRVAQ